VIRRNRGIVAAMTPSEAAIPAAVMRWYAPPGPHQERDGAFRRDHPAQQAGRGVGQTGAMPAASVQQAIGRLTRIATSASCW
jgi:hypothetical protein